LACEYANNGPFSLPTRLQAPSSQIPAGYLPGVNVRCDIWQDRITVWYVWDLNCAY
jgi:hypothetical protein